MNGVQKRKNLFLEKKIKMQMRGNCVIVSFVDIGGIY